MPTPIEQALITLLPTLPSIPPPLLSLSTSLLAQSRAKATTLKPDEEIARTFAVCHVAVLRLKQQLGIDRVNVKPPVAPRVYGKLFGYLESALGPGTPREKKETPRGKKGDDGAAVLDTPTAGRVRREGDVGKSSPASAAGGAAGQTPGSVRARSSAVPASGGRRSTRLPPKSVEPRSTRLSLRESHDMAPSNDDDDVNEIPPQARTMITAICTAFDFPEAKRHILSACSSVLAVRGYEHPTDTAIASSPLLGRKRTRTSTSTADHLHSETQQETDSRSRKRRRTGLSTSLTTLGGVTIPAITGPIVPSNLSELVAALSLFTIFTLRGQDASGSDDPLAFAKAIAAILSTFPDHAITKVGIVAFLQAVHTEGWAQHSWAQDVQSEARATRAQHHIDADVEMGEAAEIAAGPEESADGSGDDGLDDARTPREEENREPEEDDEQEQERRPLRRTPRKTNTASSSSSSRPVKTPLRRREKHAPRPDSTAHIDDEPRSSSRAGLKSGLGTMFQDAVDWLSSERCADYEGWRAWMEREILRIEQEDGGGRASVAMAVA